MSENQELNVNAQLVAHAGAKYDDESIVLGSDGLIQDVALPPQQRVVSLMDILNGDQRQLVPVISTQVSPETAALFLDGNRMFVERVARTLIANDLKESKEAAEQRKKDEVRVEVVSSQLADMLTQVQEILEEYYGATFTYSAGKLVIDVMPMNESFIMKVVNNPRLAKFLVATKSNLDLFKKASLSQRSYVFGTIQNEIMLGIPHNSIFGICANLAESSSVAIDSRAITHAARSFNDLAEQSDFFDGRDDEDYDPESDDTECTGQRPNKQARFEDTRIVINRSGKHKRTGRGASLVESQGGTKYSLFWEKVNDSANSHLRFNPLSYVLPNNKLGVGGITIVKTSDRVPEWSSQNNTTLTAGLMGVLASGSTSAESRCVRRLTEGRPTGFGFEKHPDNVSGNSRGYHRRSANRKDWRRVFFRPGFTPYNRPDS